MAIWCALFIWIVISSIYSEIEAEYLLTEEKNKKKEGKNKDNRSINRNDRTIWFVRDDSRKI